METVLTNTSQSDKQLFSEYCKNKRIDPSTFKRTEPNLYTKFEFLFSQMSEKSFTAQKLYLINELRKRFHYIRKEVKKEKTVPTKAPVIVKKAVKANNPKPTIPTPKISKKKEEAGNEEIKVKNAVKKPLIPIKNKSSESSDTLKPKIPTAKKTALKPVIKAKTTQKDTNDKSGNQETTKATPLKPKIPTAKKTALKPVIKTKTTQKDTNYTSGNQETTKTTPLKPKIPPKKP